jgi:hypothetical protein
LRLALACGEHEKRQAAACLSSQSRLTYFDAAGAAAAGADAEADADAAAGAIFLVFFALGADAEADAEAAAGALAMADAEAEAEADGAAAAKAALANREMNRAAIVLDMLFPFMGEENAIHMNLPHNAPKKLSVDTILTIF